MTMAGERVRRLVSSLSQTSADVLSGVGTQKPYSNKTSRSILADVAKSRESTGEGKECSASYAELWDGLDPCLEQASGTKQSTKDVAIALTQWSNSEKEYIKNLPFTKKRFDLPSCEAGTLGDTIESFCGSFQKIASARARLSSVIGAMGSQLHQFRREQNQTKKKLELESSKLRRGMIAQELTFQRAKQKYEKACKDAELCISLKEKAHQEKALHEVSRLWQRTTDALIAVQESEQQYRAAVDELRLHRSNYSASMATILQEYQILEESRVEYIKALIHGVVDSYTELANQNEQVLEDLRGKVNDTDSSRDIHDFVQRNHRPPMDPVVFEKQTTAKIDAEIDILVGGGLVSMAAALTHQNGLPSNSTAPGSSPIIRSAGIPPRPPALPATGSPRSLGSSPSPNSSFSSSIPGASGFLSDSTAQGPPLRHQRSNSAVPKLIGSPYSVSTKSSPDSISPPSPNPPMQSMPNLNTSIPSTPTSIQLPSPGFSSLSPNGSQENAGFKSMSSPEQKTEIPMHTARSPISSSILCGTKQQSGPPSATDSGDRHGAEPTRTAGYVPKNASEVEFVRALYDYMAEEDSELSVRVGDIIQVLEKDESGWWEGRKKDGSVGSFPENYTQAVSFAQATAYGFSLSYATPRSGGKPGVVKPQQAKLQSATPTVGIQTPNQPQKQQQIHHIIPGQGQSLPMNSKIDPIRSVTTETDENDSNSSHSISTEKHERTMVEKDRQFENNLRPALNPCSEEAPSKKVIVIFDYEAQDPCDLTVRKRAVLVVHGIDKDGGWLDASDALGNRGMVPANYTRPLQTHTQSALSA